MGVASGVAVPVPVGFGGSRAWLGARGHVTAAHLAGCCMRTSGVRARFKKTVRGEAH